VLGSVRHGAARRAVAPALAAARPARRADVGSRSDDTIEPYHARVRGAVLVQLPADRRARHHRALAIALSGTGTIAQLARHWYGAGDLEHASGYARRAGDEARAKLDFDLFVALVHDGARGPAVDLCRAPRLADPARRRARRCRPPARRAEQFLGAASGADASTTLELRRRAAGSLLQSGYVAEGLELTRTVLAGVGLAMARTPRLGLLRMVVRRAWLRIRGLGFRRARWPRSARPS